MGNAGLILDSSILIAAERQKFDLPALMADFQDHSVAICSVVASEFLHGYERAPAGPRRNRRLAFFEGLIREMPVLSFDLEIARTHAAMAAQLAVAGIGIGPHDLIIAATAVHYDWQLATLNETEFSRVPGLQLVPTSAHRR